MFPTECVCEINQKETCESLQQHFNLFYQLLSSAPPQSKDNFEKVNGIYHYLSGIPNSLQNAVIGCPEQNWDDRISGELEKFAQFPFVWYVDETASQEFKNKLKERGFTDSGIYQGVMGALKKDIAAPKAPIGCELELVSDEKTMDAFNDLVCKTLSMPEASREAYKQALWKAAQGKNPLLLHWVARKDGKVVSALTTLVYGDAVSFWNGATDPEYRCHGINTALRCLALKDAVSKGCHVGISYLMGDGMAFGICKKLGFETKWRFHAFQSPKQQINLSHKE